MSPGRGSKPEIRMVCSDGFIGEHTTEPAVSTTLLWNDQITNDLGGKGKGEGDSLLLKASTNSRGEEHTAGWVGAGLLLRKRKPHLVRIIKGCKIKEPRTRRALVNINK